MSIIKLDAIDSTNSYLRRLIHEKEVSDYTVVTAQEQTYGRGQIGTVWDSEKGKNLMFSMFKDLSMYVIAFPFYLSMAVSLAILKTFKTLGIADLHIKWPNDILSVNKKICGILIENVIKNRLNYTIIGVGINVNQTNFKQLPRASSLKMITGVHYSLEEILYLVINQIKTYSLLLEQGKYNLVKNEYEGHLFRKDKPSTFRGGNGNLFSGFIKGVTHSGKLLVILEDEIVKEYDLKEITLMY